MHAAFDQFGNTAGDNSGFATAGPREYQQRPIAMLDGLALGFRQAVEVIFGHVLLGPTLWVGVLFFQTNDILTPGQTAVASVAVDMEGKGVAEPRSLDNSRRFLT
jgi:hypothetical protein